MVPSYMSPWPTHGSSLTVLFPSFLKSKSSMSAYSNCWIYPEYFIVSLSLLIETESPVDSKEIKPVNRKGHQHWILVGRSWSSSILATRCEESTHWKSPWWWERLRAEDKRASEDEMAGWHHQCKGHELGQTSEEGEGQGCLVWCSPWGCKESNTTGWLNDNNNE